MKIGICSDSHDHVTNLKKAVIELKRKGAEVIIHSGDFVAPFSAEILKLADCPVYGVFGNCDGERDGLKDTFKEIGGELHTEPHIFEIRGLKIVVMHHPHWIEAFSHPELADLIIYGHLHELHIENRPPMVINPGEVFGRLTSGPSVVLYDSDLQEAEVIWLNDLPDVEAKN